MSMKGAGILPNDLLIVDRAVEPYNNAIVVAVLEGEFTLKRLQKTSAGVFLAPENRSYQRVKVTETTDFQVWGVVTHVIREIRCSTL